MEFILSIETKIDCNGPRMPLGLHKITAVDWLKDKTCQDKKPQDKLDQVKIHHGKLYYIVLLLFHTSSLGSLM